MTATMEHKDYLELEGENEDFLEFEGEYEHERGSAHGDYVPRFVGPGYLEFEDEHEDFLGGLLSSVLGGEVAGPLSEHAEMELASQLLEVGSEQELEQFLGNLFKKVARGVSGFARSGVGRALGGVLKNVAKRALPVVGGALGSMVAPGVGTAIGSRLGSLASGLLEMEGEVNEPELELEMARRVVRIGAAAARTASRVPARSAPPQVIARRALIGATRRHAPGVFGRGRVPLRPGAPLPRFRGRRPAATGYGTASRRRPRPPYPPRPIYWYGYDPDNGYQDSQGHAAGNGSGPGAPDYDADGYPEGPAAGTGGGRAGRWVRRGTTIVLHDV
jgi:uncharacterized protein (DUF697 family)